MLAALGEAVGSQLDVGLVECTIDGMVVCALDDTLPLLVFLILEVDFVDILGTVEVSAVAEELI